MPSTNPVRIRLVTVFKETVEAFHFSVLASVMLARLVTTTGLAPPVLTR